MEKFVDELAEFKSTARQIGQKEVHDKVNPKHGGVVCDDLNKDLDRWESKRL